MRYLLKGMKNQLLTNHGMNSASDSCVLTPTLTKVGRALLTQMLICQHCVASYHLYCSVFHRSSLRHVSAAVW